MNSPIDAVSASPRSAPGLAVGAAVAGLALGLCFRHRGLYNDGIFFVQWLGGWPLQDGEKHALVYPHLLYLPLAKTFHEGIGALLGLGIDGSLKLLSAICLGAAGPALVRLFGAFLDRTGTAWATALVLLAPSVAFFAGATELHTLHLAAAAFALSMAARPPRRHATLGFAAGAVLVAGTHLTGVLQLPAMLLLLARARRRGIAPDGPAPLRAALAAAAGIALLAGAGLAAHVLGPDRSVLSEYFRSVHPAEQSVLATVSRELLLESGLLAVGSMLALPLLARQEPWLAAATLATLVPYAAFIGRSAVEYHGGYNLPALPVLALAAVAGARALPTRVIPVAIVLTLAAQAALSLPSAGAAARSDLHRDLGEAIAARAAPGDVVLLFVPPAAVDFDLTHLSNLTRLYLPGRVVANGALLDASNAIGTAYLDDAGAARVVDDWTHATEAALGRGGRVFAAPEIVAPDATGPRLRAWASALLVSLTHDPVAEGATLVELRRR